MFDNERFREITALELYDLLYDFAIEIEETTIMSFVTALMIKEYFPLLSANFPDNEEDFKSLAKTMSTTITESSIAKFSVKFVDYMDEGTAFKLGLCLCHILFDKNNSHINNKEVN